MAASKVPDFCTRIAVLCIILVSVGDQAAGLNLGLFAGDNKRHSNPLFIKKVSRHSPVFININSGLGKLPKPILSLPKPPKPPPLNLAKLRLSKLKTPLLSRKVPRSLLTPMLLSPLLPRLPILPPIIPKLPILPLIPPLLPPLLPPLPILPIPLLPPILPVPKLPKPLKVPILGKTPLQKALGSELKPIVLPLATSISADNKKIRDKLLQLKKAGSLTTAEYLRFRKLLLQK